MTKEIVLWENIILNMYTPEYGAWKFMKQILTSAQKRTEPERTMFKILNNIKIFLNILEWIK